MAQEKLIDFAGPDIVTYRNAREKKLAFHDRTVTDIYLRRGEVRKSVLALISGWARRFSDHALPERVSLVYYGRIAAKMKNLDDPGFQRVRPTGFPTRHLWWSR